jgi:hypothetical protein
MAILPPPPVTPIAGRSLLYDALAQNDVDMAFHRLLNLDTSNLPPVGIPPTVHPPANQWLHDWDASSQQWTSTQPGFGNLSGFLTGAQMAQITQVGTIMSGSWAASVIANQYLPSLDQIRPPLANVDFGGFRGTGLAMPINPNDAVNLAYMDLLLAGLQPKQAVRCATTSDTPLVGLARTIDGVSLVAGDRVLVKSQSVSRVYENGIYIASTGTWVRSTDADNAAELKGAYCTVLEGALNSGTSWVQPNTLTDPLNTDDVIQFVLFSTHSDILPGAGLNRVVNTLNVLGTLNRILVGTGVDIDPGYVGQTSITTLGTIIAGTWNGSLLDGAHGGTGVANPGMHINLLGDFSTVSFSGSPVGTPLTFQLAGNTNLILPIIGTLATLGQPETFANKRITRRVAKIASNPNPAINVDALDAFYITLLSGAILSMTANLTGTPTDCQELVLWIKDNAVAGGQSITWGAAWAASSDLPLPTLTTPGVWLFLSFTYNSEKLKWVLNTKLNNIAP